MKCKPTFSKVLSCFPHFQSTELLSKISNNGFNGNPTISYSRFDSSTRGPTDIYWVLIQIADPFCKKKNILNIPVEYSCLPLMVLDNDPLMSRPWESGEPGKIQNTVLSLETSIKVLIRALTKLILPRALDHIPLNGKLLKVIYCHIY